MTTVQKLRWGVLGVSSIARRSVIPGIRESELGEVAAIASRDLDRARQAADELGIPAAYGSYEELLADESLDAVYVPLPNHLHKEWSIKALRAGKHVLCEKPIALTEAEAEEMAAVAKETGLVLAEAFMYRHHPRYGMIQGIVESGEIGEIRGIHGTFTFNNSAASANVRFRRDWGGGGLYDVGCYPITAARLLLGREPEAVTVRAFRSPEHDGVDMMASGMLEFPGDVALTFDCGMWAAGRNTLEVLGTKGIIEVPSAFVAGPDARANFFVTAGGERREVEVPRVNQFALEIDDFARTALHGEQQKFGPEDAVRNMRILEACMRSADERARISL